MADNKVLAERMILGNVIIYAFEVFNDDIYGQIGIRVELFNQRVIGFKIAEAESPSEGVINEGQRPVGEVHRSNNIKIFGYGKFNFGAVGQPYFFPSIL